MDALHIELDLTSEAEFESFEHVDTYACSCSSCDAARKAKVAAFAASWMARHSISEPEELPCEQSGVRTVRPPAMSRRAA